MTDCKTLEKILRNAIQNLEDGNFENVSFYSFLPEALALEETGSYRSVDEYIAVHAIKFPELHRLMCELVDFIADCNNQNTIWDNEEEHAGGAIARELALYDKSNVALFARFISSNDLNHEVYQAEDMEAVVKKWGPCRETYSVVAARWLTPGQHRYEFDYDAVSDTIKTKAQVEQVMEALAQWFSEGWYQPYNISTCYNDVIELMEMLFVQMNYANDEIEELIDTYIEDASEPEGEEDLTGRSVIIQDKKTLEMLVLIFDTDKAKLNVNYAFTQNVAMEYSDAGTLCHAIEELEARCRAQGYVWETTNLPPVVDSTIEIYETKVGQPVDVLSFFTPAGEETPAEKMAAALYAGQKKISCRKLQLYRSSSSMTVICCDIAGKRLLDTGAYESEYLWSYKTEAEMLAALETIQAAYIAKGYQLTRDEIVDFPFDYTLEQTKQTAAVMKQRAEQIANGWDEDEDEDDWDEDDEDDWDDDDE